MNKSKNLFALAIITILTLACSSSEEAESNIDQTDSSLVTVENPPEKEDLSFDIKIEVEKISVYQYYLSTTMFLDDGAYYASPFSNNSFTGLFNIEIDADERLFVDENLIESPKSVETMDALSNEPVNWVKEETNYKQMLTIISDEDFDISGLVSAVVEPVCNRYEIAFQLHYKGGNLSVTQSAAVVKNLSN